MIRRVRNVGLAIILAASPSFADELKIAALGDSLTQGFGLPADDGFVPQLERWLQAQGAEVKLVNAGVSGDTTAGGLARTEWTLTPDIGALIVALGGNDLLRGIEPSSSRENLRGILEIASGRDLPILLVGMEAPSNYGSEFKSSFDGMYPELSEQFGTEYYPNFVGAITSLEPQAEAIEKFIQPDRIHPNADGVALIVQDMGPSVLSLIERALGEN
ncbi:MAG: arylesterase [Boseongicola sp.]|nr:arylesterase [Boseongicola sp.]